MKEPLLSKYSRSLVLLIILTGLLSVIPSCGGGGGGGRGGGGPTGPPYISAGLISLPTGSSLPGYESAWVEVLDNNTGYPITNAIVTINGVSLAYDSTEEDYEGDVIVAPGGSVVLNVSVGGITYTASVTQLASYPTISSPASGASWISGLPNTIEWSGNYPTTNTLILLGIIGNDTNGELLWPSNGYLLEFISTETAYTIPADSLTSCNGLVIVAVGMEIPISSAAPDSSFVIGGFDYAPITIKAPTVLASGLKTPYDIAVDATCVYWTEPHGGSVKKVGINGGAVTTLASGLIYPQSITVDSSSVYWLENAPFGSGAVKKIGINAGTVTTLASGLYNPYGGIAVDSTSVYWTDYAGGTVNKVGINGGGITNLAFGLISPNSMTIDSLSVYWAEAGGTVNKIGIFGGAITTLASGLTSPNSVKVDSNSVYWLESVYHGSGSIKKVGINGGTVTTLASGFDTLYGDIVVDSASVYWTDHYEGTVKKVGINGGAVTNLAAGLKMPQGIALDATSVYWAEYTGGTIKKIAK